MEIKEILYELLGWFRSGSHSVCEGQMMKRNSADVIYVV